MAIHNREFGWDVIYQRTIHGQTFIDCTNRDQLYGAVKIEVKCWDNFEHENHKSLKTISAYFTIVQREATKIAANLAGLEVIRIITEPTAAAINSGHTIMTGVHYVLALDIGDGTKDMSIISYVNECTRVINGDNLLGGVDFDERLLNHCLIVIKDAHKKDIKTIQPRQMMYLFK